MTDDFASRVTAAIKAVPEGPDREDRIGALVAQAIDAAGAYLDSYSANVYRSQIRATALHELGGAQ